MRKFYTGVSGFLLLAGIAQMHAQTVTFNYTGAVQTYVVPPCVTQVVVNASGAQGGGPNGGMGGNAVATIPVTPGNTLYVYVGGQPTIQLGPGGFNGGGATLALPCGGGSDGYPGGGASDVRSSTNINDRMIVAGGGGGGGWSSGLGGAGGGTNGSDGAASWIAGTHGKGGTQSAGGLGGYYTGNSQSAGSGSLGQGGDAGPPNTYCTGGAGGGGYYGGGGGYVSAGGGGSSYISYPGSTSTSTTAGTRSGNGIITITSVPGTPASPASIGGSNSLCEGSSATYTISAVIGATGYTWTVPAGATITSGQGTTSINVTFGSNSGNVSVTADNGCGSSNATVYAITVNPAPSVVANTTASTVCAGATIILSGSGAASYVWSDGVTDGVAFMPGITHTYTVTGTNANGCTNTATVNVTVDALPSVSATSTDSAICIGNAVTLNGGGASSYAWSGNVIDGVSFAPTATDTYTVTGTDANGCTNTAMVTVTVNPLPVVTASTPITMACLDDADIALTGTPAGGTWMGPGINGNDFTPSAAGAGNYHLVYQFTDANGCADTAGVGITVDLCLTVNAMAASSQMNVYPNPNNGSFTITINEAANTLLIEVMDLQGRIISSNAQQHTAAGFTQQVNLQQEADGMYVVRVTLNGVQQTQRITVAH